MVGHRDHRMADGIARLIRGEVLKQRSLDYTLAAQALGASHRRILFRHILKNSLSPALVSIPFGIAGAIITEAGLSVLGFGVEPPAPTWGGLLQQATRKITTTGGSSLFRRSPFLSRLPYSTSSAAGCAMRWIRD